MSTEKQYPTSATYAISDFFSAKTELDTVVSEMWSIRDNCDIGSLWGADLTGRVNGSSYAGLELAGKLLPEFEEKKAAYVKAKAALKAAIPAADYDCLTYSTDTREDFKESSLNRAYEEIKKFFDLTHDNYKHKPAPEKAKVSPINGLVNLAAYVSLVYVVWNIFF